MKNKKKKIGSKFFWFLVCGFTPMWVVPLANSKNHELPEDQVLPVSLIASGICFVIIIVSLIKNGGKSSGGTRSIADDQPEVRILRDPATGAERLFTKHPGSGEWVSEDGTVLDEDRLAEWQQGRRKDREWQQKENEKIASGRTAMDDELRKIDKAAAEEEARISAEAAKQLENLRKFGTIDTNEDHIRAIIERNTRLAELQSRMYNRHGKVAGAMEDIAGGILTAADWGMEALGEVTGPVGKYGIKNAYYAARNTAFRLSDAFFNDKDMGSALRHAAADTIVDVTQATVESTGYKIAANTLGDGVKGYMDAVDKGEDAVEGAASGMIGGLARTGVDKLAGSAADNARKQVLKKGAGKLQALRSQYWAGDMSSKTYQGAKNIITKSTLSASKSVKAGASVTNSAAQKLTTELTDKLFNTHRKAKL